MKVLAAITILIGFAGCEPSERAFTPPREPITFTNARFHRITPTVEGGAYAETLSSLYYLEGGGARKVIFPDGFKVIELLSLEITPLQNGGAYMISDLGSGIWWLNGIEARKVSMPPPPTLSSEESSDDPLSLFTP
jgi:hypothetical protein